MKLIEYLHFLSNHIKEQLILQIDNKLDYYLYDYKSIDHIVNFTVSQEAASHITYPTSLVEPAFMLDNGGWARCSNLANHLAILKRPIYLICIL